MSKTAFDFIKEQMYELAKSDSTSAGGWEAVEDMAKLKMNVQYQEYFIAATIKYLQTQPYPKKDTK